MNGKCREKVQELKYIQWTGNNLKKIKNIFKDIIIDNNDIFLRSSYNNSFWYTKIKINDYIVYGFPGEQIFICSKEFFDKQYDKI